MSQNPTPINPPSKREEQTKMCSCIAEMDNMLREHNTCLVTTMFRKPEVVAVRTDKIDTRVRKGPATVIASYCPFCGEKYAEHDAARAALSANT